MRLISKVCLAIAAAALHAIGWRIALGIGVLIVPFGLALRRGLTETLHSGDPADASTQTAANPTVRILVLALLLLASGTTITYVLNYLTTYATHSLHMPSSLAFGGTVVRGFCAMLGAVLGGWLADRIGRRLTMLVPGFALLVLTVPGFALLAHDRTALALYGVTGGLSILGGVAGTAVLVAITESLPKPTRSTSLAVVYAVSISIFGGTAQFNVAWLTDATHSLLAPAWYMAIGVAAGLVGMIWIGETQPGKAASRPIG